MKQMIGKKRAETAYFLLALTGMLLLANWGNGQQPEGGKEREVLAVSGQAGTDGNGGTGTHDAEEAALAGKLYAKAAVLLDMDSGRVLYEKNGGEMLPMASTTKIMTCILALEEGDRTETVTVSAYAAGQPKVHLGMQKGASYEMDDLLHSLMLESHNDSAVAIAEHLGAKGLNLPAPEERTKEQSKEAVRAFCDRMTEKAREIGCEHTVFLTPNGLDAEAEGPGGEKIFHGTTAEELAEIMRYCATQSEEKEAFLEITRTASCTFSDLEGKQSYSCVNHNAFLTMMEGAMTGKTGFTNQAGYCYVGALERDGRQFALALLACGWPNHKTWKWSDSRTLFGYGLEHYTYRDFAPEVALDVIPVENGAADSGNPYEAVSINPGRSGKVLPIRILTKQTEAVVAEADIRKTLTAPVEKGMCVGSISYYLMESDGSRQLLEKEEVLAEEAVEKQDLGYVFRFVLSRYLLE